MLAGRKLLLADDSVTIQKVIDLTFADEGVDVVSVGDGLAALELVEQLVPDVVLADVFMPELNGYEVCEYIKGSEKLKHIPVMLLVGSFEPFDEAEARRVGANDTLTKPFQSIRRLIEKVGDLVNSKPSAAEVPTAELHQPEVPAEPQLSTAELEMTTADTLQLPADLAHQAEQHIADKRAAERSDENKMESHLNEMQTGNVSESTDTLLDLGEFEATQYLEAEEFELDLDLDEPESVPAPIAYSAPAYVGSHVSAPAVGWDDSRENAPIEQQTVLRAEPLAAENSPQEARFNEQDYRTPVSGADARLERPVSETISTVTTDRPALTSQASVDNLSPQLIDAIARRAVEHLSEKVVQEIAWEVVPQLAEILIRRQLEEKESQAK